MLGKADVLGDDRAAEERIDEWPISRIASHEFGCHAEHPLLIEQVDGVDRTKVAYWVEGRSPKVFAHKQFDRRHGVFLRFDDDSVKAVGEGCFNRTFEAGRHTQ